MEVLPSSRSKGSVRKTRLVQKNAEVLLRLSVNSVNVPIELLRDEFPQVIVSESWGTVWSRCLLSVPVSIGDNKKHITSQLTATQLDSVGQSHAEVFEST